AARATAMGSRPPVNWGSTITYSDRSMLMISDRPLVAPPRHVPEHVLVTAADQEDTVEPLRRGRRKIVCPTVESGAQPGRRLLEFRRSIRREPVTVGMSLGRRAQTGEVTTHLSIDPEARQNGAQQLGQRSRGGGGEQVA